MDKENILYYQSNIKTSRNEDSVYAMKYASQQMLIDKLEQQCKKQKEVIDKLEIPKETLWRQGFLLENSVRRAFRSAAIS